MWFIIEERRRSSRPRAARNPKGWWRLRADLGVARGQRCPASPPPRSLISARKRHQRNATYLRRTTLDPLLQARPQFAKRNLDAAADVHRLVVLIRHRVRVANDGDLPHVAEDR